MIKTSLARRDFLKASLAVPFTTSLALAKEAASDVRITRVVHCRIPTKRSKLAGKNSRGGVHGDSSGDVLLRLFAEEMFPETVDDCLTFKAFLRESKLKTLVADGESHKEASTFKPFVKARAIDILQGDMKRFGFEGIMEESAMAAEENLLVAPHNWGHSSATTCNCRSDELFPTSTGPSTIRSRRQSSSPTVTLERTVWLPFRIPRDAVYASTRKLSQKKPRYSTT